MSRSMKFRFVDPKKIRIPTVRVTSVWDPDEYEVFKASLEADGIQNPIICIFDGKEYWLADGKHRLEEALLKGDKTIPVAWKEGTLVDAKLRNLYLNRLHGKTKASEEVTLIRDLYENDGLDLQKIAEKTGFPLERIEQRLAISRADPYVQEMLDNERIGVGIAFELSRLPNPKGQIRLLQELVKLPTLPNIKWVREVVDESIKLIEEKASSPSPPPIGPPIRTIECGFCEERYVEREMVGVNTCRTCLGLAKDYIQELKRKRFRGETPEQALARRVAESGSKPERRQPQTEANIEPRSSIEPSDSESPP